MGFGATINENIEVARDNSLLASMDANGLPPIVGKWFYVDPTSGAAANDGLTPGTAVASIATAYDKCTSGAGDGIAVISRGTTAAGTTSYLTAALAWSKWGITAVGVCAPTRFSQRARIANATASVDLANLLNISGSNNAFYNLSIYNGGTTGAGGVLVSGDRNYFQNVHMMGGMGMTTATVNDYSLLIDGGDENTFVNCVAGNDTVDKTDIAGAELHFDNGAMRNRFYGCEFVSYRSAQTANPGMIKLIGAGDSITRTVIFDNCTFQLYDDGNMPTSAAVVIGTSPNNGLIVFKDCLRIGFTDWAGAATSRVYSGSPTLHESGGLVIAANPS